MSEKKIGSMDDIREYCMDYYGRVPEAYETMGRYLPDTMMNWIELRKSIFKNNPGGLTMREKELISLAIEITARKPKQQTGAETHAKLAIKNGATVTQISEVVAICMLLAGMMTYIVSGHTALKTAEEYNEELENLKTVPH